MGSCDLIDISCAALMKRSLDGVWNGLELSHLQNSLVAQQRAGIDEAQQRWTKWRHLPEQLAAVDFDPPVSLIPKREVGSELFDISGGFWLTPLCLPTNSSLYRLAGSATQFASGLFPDWPYFHKPADVEKPLRTRLLSTSGFICRSVCVSAVIINRAVVLLRPRPGRPPPGAGEEVLVQDTTSERTSAG